MNRYLTIFLTLILCACLSLAICQEKKDEAIKDEPVKEEVKKNETTKDEAPKVDIKNDETVKDETKKEEVKKDDRWSTDYDSALQSAKEKNKNIFIDFYAEWCAPCKMMDETFADAKIIAAMQEMVLLRIDVDKEKELAQKYSVTQVPTYLILDSNAQVIDRFTNYYEVDDFLTKLKEVREGIGTFKSLKESVEKNPEDVELALKLFTKYLEFGDMENSKTMAETVKKLDSENKKGYYAEALFYQGYFAIGEQNFDKAIEIYNEFINKFPQDKKIENVMYFKALLYVMKGEVDTSITLFNEFLQKFPNSPSKAKIEEILGQLQKMKEEETLQKSQQEQGKTQEQKTPQEPEKIQEKEQKN